LVQGWRWFQQGAFDQAITSWMEAARLYGRAGNPNKQSETLTYLSRAYRSIGQHRQALQNLESTPALVKSLYRWQWQTARLLKALRKLDDAISAYGRAVATFKPIRQGPYMSYVSTGSSFRDSIGPVYYELQ
jgi:tetratricopeptide (TPR) repeat protein